MKRLTKCLLIAGGLLAAMNGWADGNYHGHHSDRGNYHSNQGYYHGGGGYYGGRGYYNPNVIINVPLAPRPRYYRPYCESVEVCNQFNECWIERECH